MAFQQSIVMTIIREKSYGDALVYSYGDASEQSIVTTYGSKSQLNDTSITYDQNHMSLFSHASITHSNPNKSMLSTIMHRSGCSAIIIIAPSNLIGSTRVLKSPNLDCSPINILVTFKAFVSVKCTFINLVRPEYY